MDVITSNFNTSYKIEVDEDELRLLMLGLGHLAKPEKLTPHNDDKQKAWELNKKLLYAKLNSLAGKVKSVQDTLQKVEEIEEEEK